MVSTSKPLAINLEAWDDANRGGWLWARHCKCDLTPQQAPAIWEIVMGCLGLSLPGLFAG